MSRRLLVWLFLLLCAVALSAQTATAAAPRPVTEKDLFQFVWIGDPQISPDGSRAAFVRVTVNDKKDGYITEIWSVATSGGQAPVRLTAGPHDASPRWSPDGQWLAFVRSSEKDGKPQPPQIHLLPLSGGEPRAFTALPKGAAAPVWSPDGKTIAFSSDTTSEDIAKEEKKKSGAEEERESDVRVVNRAIYRINGEGYLDYTHPGHIWIANLPASAEAKVTPRPVTAGVFDEDPPVWSPNGSRLYFTSTRSVEPYYELPTHELYSVAASGGDIRKEFSFPGQIGDFSFSPDGKWIAFEGAFSKPPHFYNQPHLFVVAATPGATPRQLAPELDTDIGSDIIGDQHAPRGGASSSPFWSQDGHWVYDAVSEKGASDLRRFEVASGQVQAVTSGKHEVGAWTATAGAGRIVALVSDPLNIGDLYELGTKGELDRLTWVNQSLHVAFTEPEEIWYASFDGRKIQAFVQKPTDFDPKKKYPLILNIHGGPHAAYGYNFFHEMQWMAAKGYVVLFPNPRGSTTYGHEFADLIEYRYPGDDAKDLMAGVDELIRRGYIDEHKLGVTGGSGGGVLTNWLVGHTDRFAAAASQRSIADFGAWWYAVDFTLFNPVWFHGAPWEQEKEFKELSPLTYINQVKTPLMFIEGEADYRTPPATGGEEMFRALKYLHKTAVMVRFPGESHELSRSGQPWHRVERLQHIVNWFDIYLQGKELHTYDLPRATPMPAAGNP